MARRRRTTILTLLDSRLKVSVHPEHVLRDHPVALLVHVVRHDEQQIESRQQRVGEGNVAVRVLVHIVL